MTNRYKMISGLLAVGALVICSLPALALDPYGVPVISCVGSTQHEITLRICGDAVTGAPAGVTVQWMPKTLYDEVGWLDSSDPSMCALSLSGQPSLQHPGASRWELLPGECEEIIIGQINFDETGVSGNDCALGDLDCGTEYVFRAFAHAGRRMARSEFTDNISCSTSPCTGGCTFTQGYWKTHGPEGCVTGNNSNEWPVSSLTLGTVPYTDLELCSILNKPAGGNGLLTLAHQLIAAKLNVANGGGCDAVASSIAAADALIGSKVCPPVGNDTLSPSATSSLTMTLDVFNQGGLSGCPAHCGEESGIVPGAPTPAQGSTWGGIKSIYR